MIRSATYTSFVTFQKAEKIGKSLSAVVALKDEAIGDKGLLRFSKIE